MIRERLPRREEFASLARNAVVLRARDLTRRVRGGIEPLFRDRLRAEGIPIAMSPPVRVVPGLLVARRKPDGVYPDPATGRPPLLYLEIKNIRRPADDIQKRLYELAEASLEMKMIYGDIVLRGLSVASPRDVWRDPSLRERVRAQVVGRPPIVVALLLCPRTDAERYRDGAETFVDRIFFQEEIEECLQFLRRTVEGFEPRPL